MRKLMREAARKYFEADVAQHRHLSPSATGINIALCFLLAAAIAIFSYVQLSWYVATPITLFVGTLAFIFSMVQLFLAGKMSENGLIKSALSAWGKLTQKLPGLKRSGDSPDVSSNTPETQD